VVGAQKAKSQPEQPDLAVISRMRMVPTGAKPRENSRLASGQEKETLMILVDYVRAVLPADQPLEEDDRRVSNGDVSYSYTLRKP